MLCSLTWKTRAHNKQKENLGAHEKEKEKKYSKFNVFHTLGLKTFKFPSLNPIW
jgi:hypothetical protein